MGPKKRQNRITAREIRATSQNFHAAFTLIELLAVLVIGATLLGMAMLPMMPIGAKQIRLESNASTTLKT